MFSAPKIVHEIKAHQKHEPAEMQTTETEMPLNGIIGYRGQNSSTLLCHLLIQQIFIKHLLGAQSSFRHYKFSGRSKNPIFFKKFVI